MLHVSGSRRGEYGLSYLTNDDRLSLAVDSEGQMATYVAKPLKLCSGLVVLMNWTSGQRLLLLSLER